MENHFSIPEYIKRGEEIDVLKKEKLRLENILRQAKYCYNCGHVKSWKIHACSNCQTCLEF